MKFIVILFFFLLINNCSLNKNSKYWNVTKRKNDQKKLSEILKKADDITTMTEKEYEIFIDDFTKKSKYPDITLSK